MGFWSWILGGQLPTTAIVDRGRLARGFGPGHNGLDIVAPEGTPVRAFESGSVAANLEIAGYGNVLMLRHEGRDIRPPRVYTDRVATSIYAHLQARAPFAVDDYVEGGQQIGRVGRTVEGFSYAWLRATPPQGFLARASGEHEFLARTAGARSNGGVTPIAAHVHLEVWWARHPQIGPLPPEVRATQVAPVNGVPFDPIPWFNGRRVIVARAPWSPPAGAPLALH